MYGGGMGDQIRRYCDEMESDVIIFIFSIDFGNDDDVRPEKLCYSSDNHHVYFLLRPITD